MRIRISLLWIVHFQIKETSSQFQSIHVRALGGMPAVKAARGGPKHVDDLFEGYAPECREKGRY
jgi:hypothetical protein